MGGIFLELQDRLIVVGLIYARLIPIFTIIPIFNKSALSGNVTRNALIFVIIIGLWPAIDTSYPLVNLDPFDYAVLAAKEAIIGSAIGFMLSLPFWIFSAVGSYVDMARGASMGSLIDPTNGQESTETANLLNFCTIVVYLQLGGMRYLMEALVTSYNTIGLTQGFTVNVDQVIPFLGNIITQGFIIASPVLLMLLVTESLLGLFSRFTPQLNAFSISLTIKSVLAFFVLSMYIWQIFPEKLSIFMGDFSNIQLLNGVVAK